MICNSHRGVRASGKKPPGKCQKSRGRLSPATKAHHLVRKKRPEGLLVSNAALALLLLFNEIVDRYLVRDLGHQMHGQSSSRC
jgi:hypothetical protein